MISHTNAYTLDTIDLFFLLYMQGFPGVADVGKSPPTCIGLNLFTFFSSSYKASEVTILKTTIINYYGLSIAK